MIDKLKKYWFIIIIVAIFIAGIGYYGVSEYNSIFKGKKVDGKDVVSEINGNYLLADDLYDDLYDQYGSNQLYMLFERSILTNLEISDELKTKAAAASATTRTNMESQGTTGLEQLDTILISLGYSGRDDLTTYYEDYEKRNNLIREYLTDNYDSVTKTFMESVKPRIVSHILVAMDDPANPTDLEKQKMEQVEAAIAEGKTFAEVAASYSDDTATAPEGGLLGYLDSTNTSYLAAFVTGAMSVEAGETSEWVQTSYGWHLIHVDAADFETVSKEDDFVISYINSSPQTLYTVLWDAAQELNVTFKDDKTKEDILNYMGIEASE